MEGNGRLNTSGEDKIVALKNVVDNKGKITVGAMNIARKDDKIYYVQGDGSVQKLTKDNIDSVIQGRGETVKIVNDINEYKEPQEGAFMYENDLEKIKNLLSDKSQHEGAANLKVRIDFEKIDNFEEYECLEGTNRKVTDMVDEYNHFLSAVKEDLAERENLIGGFKRGEENYKVVENAYKSLRESSINIDGIKKDSYSIFLINKEKSELASYYLVLKKQNELLIDEIKNVLKVNNAEKVFDSDFSIKDKYLNKLDPELFDKYQNNNKVLGDVKKISDSFSEEDKLKIVILKQKELIIVEADKYDTNSQIEKYIKENFEKEKDVLNIIDKAFHSKAKELDNKESFCSNEKYIKKLLLRDKEIAFAYLEAKKNGNNNDKKEILEKIKKYLNEVFKKVPKINNENLMRTLIDKAFNNTEFAKSNDNTT